MNGKSATSRKRRFAIIVLVIALAAVAWIIFDLYAPRTAHLREFNPDEVAQLETAMWRSYYDKQRVRLFNQLSELLRTQYNMPLIRSNRVAYYAANAAFVFKNGKQRSGYEKALPDLLKFYQSIRKMSDLPFDVNRAARLELEWWISFYSKSFSIRKAGNDSPSGVRISVGSIILYPIAEYRGSPGNVATSSIFKKPDCRAASSQHLMIRLPMPRRDHLGCT